MQPINKIKPKKLGIWICIALVVGNMIGSGIFLLPATLAPYGGVSILGWMLTTLGALMTALVFARLSRKFPRQGGPYRYTYDNFGSFAGFSVAWSHWVSIWCGNAAIAIATVTYLSFFWPQLAQNSILSIISTLAIIWFLTFLNCRGIRKAGIFQLVVTVLKLVPLIALGLFCLVVFDHRAFEPFNLSGESLVSSITATAALTLWAFLGIESATIPADNVKNPQKTIPRATIIGFLITAIVYISSQLTIMSTVPNNQLQQSGAPFADAATIIWGNYAGYVVAVGAVISCLGALNGWILLQGQIPMAVARDKLLPEVFNDKNNSGVSIYALVLSSILISLLVLTNFSAGLIAIFTFAILLSILGMMIPYLCSVAVDIMLIIKNWQVNRDYFSVTTSVLAIGYFCWVISVTETKILLWGLALFFSGTPVYIFMRFKLMK
jgi:basic amino acid/polyamine antiporter, APA family